MILLIAPIKGKDMVVLEFMVILFPDIVQVTPDGREQEAPLAVN